MAASGVRGIDLFKIAGRSISGWIPSFKTGNPHHVLQPFCSQLEERLLMYLEYHPQVAWYARGDIDSHFAATYRLPTPKDAPFAIGYVFEGQPHDYLPDVVGTLANGKLFIAEAGLEDEKREARQQAKAEAARKLARRLGGVYWLATEQTLSIQKHYNFVSLHARRQSFPDFAAIETALHEVWPWGEVASVDEVVPRLLDRWSATLVEAAIWKVMADAAACGYLLVDLTEKHLDRRLPLALLPPDAPPIVPDPLPDTLPSISVAVEPPASPSPTVIPGPPFDASSLEDAKREHYLRNLRAVEAVLAGAQVSSTAKAAHMAPSTLSRLVQRTRELGAIACVPYGSRTRKLAFHPAFQECIRRLYLLPTRLSIAAIHEHTEMRQVAKRLSEETGKTVALPSYDQVRKEVHRLKSEPALVAMREGAIALPRERQSPNSFALSIPAPALVTQVDEHTLELYVVTPDGITVTIHVHAAVLVCVKTASILAAVLALGPLKEEDYMRLLKQALEPKDGFLSCGQDASIPGPVTANQPSCFMTGARSSPPSGPGLCWLIAYRSLPSKLPHIALQRKARSNPSFVG
jgi:transposase